MKRYDTYRYVVPHDLPIPNPTLHAPNYHPEMPSWSIDLCSTTSRSLGVVHILVVCGVVVRVLVVCVLTVCVPIVVAVVWLLWLAYGI